ncbi:Hypothetical protein CAP_1648 [Chondromyces apiculatus DSM 436]|uniref:Uncharacterized protein n=1 Tax=Chondromyces apiculatus DSM 436 TaxID=1192034 RepID=A0A017TB56_9BACT|nr:Hypothetical protein CAP_1648 [Chondromyces apiculatus DSM 436]
MLPWRSRSRAGGEAALHAKSARRWSSPCRDVVPGSSEHAGPTLRTPAHG